MQDIEYTKYNSSPHDILDLLSRCTKQIPLEKINDHTAECDIPRLINDGWLIETDNGVIAKYANHNVLMVQYKKQKQLLNPVINFKKYILLLDMAKTEFNNTLNEFKNTYYNESLYINIPYNEHVKLEYCVRNIVTTISSIRDFTKTNIVETSKSLYLKCMEQIKNNENISDRIIAEIKKTLYNKSNGHYNKLTDWNTNNTQQYQDCLYLDEIKKLFDNVVTPILISKYTDKQECYDTLLSKTVDDPLIKGINDLLRNALLHGDDTMLINVDWQKIHYDSSNVDVQPILTMDYQMLEDTKRATPTVKDRLIQYYSDHTYNMLSLVSNKNYNYNLLEDTDRQRIESDLMIRYNRKNISLDKEIIDSYLNDNSMILYMYNLWQSKNIPSQGQFRFNLSKFIKNLYSLHMKLYMEMYDFICTTNNNEIKKFMELQKKLCSLSDKYIQMEQSIDFSLQLRNKPCGI